MNNAKRDKRIRSQSGLIQIWILFVSIMLPVFIGFMVLMTNVISAKNTVYYSKMVLNGSLYAASHAQDSKLMARGIKQLDVPKAQQLFNETLRLYRSAENVGYSQHEGSTQYQGSTQPNNNVKLANKLEVNANNIVVIPPGQITPRGYKTLNDTLYIEGQIPFTIKLPFINGDLVSMTLKISASQKFVVVNYLDRTIY
jgi:hypothetical protein